jgi:hypothetical protein
MSEVQDKILQAGIVPKQAVAQMEQWQTSPAGSAAKVGEANIDKVRSLRGDLELRGLPTIRESLMDIKKLMDRARPVNLINKPASLIGAMAGVDRLDRYIFEIPRTDAVLHANLTSLLRPMTTIIDSSRNEPEDERRIIAVSLLYNDTTPTHLFCETETAVGNDTIIRGK